MRNDRPTSQDSIYRNIIQQINEIMVLPGNPTSGMVSLKKMILDFCHTYCYDYPIKSEDGEVTRGVHSEWQANNLLRILESMLNGQPSILLNVAKDILEIMPPEMAVYASHEAYRDIKARRILCEINDDSDTFKTLKPFVKFLKNEIEIQTNRKEMNQDLPDTNHCSLFLSSFDYLGNPSIQKGYEEVPNKGLRDKLMAGFKATHNQISLILRLKPGSKYLDPIMEIQEKLYQLPDDARRIIYLKSIIRDVAGKTLAYFNYSYNGEHYRLINNEGSTDLYQNKQGSITKEIIRRDSIGEGLTSKYELYVVYCYNLRQQFMWQLDAVCFDFGLNLDTIQQEMSTVIQQRDWSVLSYYGHNQSDHKNQAPINQRETIVKPEIYPGKFTAEKLAVAMIIAKNHKKDFPVLASYKNQGYLRDAISDYIKTNHNINIASRTIVNHFPTALNFEEYTCTNEQCDTIVKLFIELGFPGLADKYKEEFDKKNRQKNNLSR